MDRNCFWLPDAQFATITPRLLRNRRGKPRIDDRRVISGIVHVLKPASAGSCSGRLRATQDAV